MFRSFIILIFLTLTACTNSQTETRALKTTAIADARVSSRSLKLAYLDCYALPDYEKSPCRTSARINHHAQHDASNWNYIRPFNHELERLGFVAFLKDHNKPCNRLDEGPAYSAEKKAYIVNCTDGNRYKMRFDRKAKSWEVQN